MHRIKAVVNKKIEELVASKKQPNSNPISTPNKNVTSTPQINNASPMPTCDWLSQDFHQDEKATPTTIRAPVQRASVNSSDLISFD